jgi:ribonuclease-3
MPELASLQERLGYVFRDESLLIQALTHTSYAHERPTPTAHNERLEFLGDAVLDLVLSEHLLGICPEASEGDLSRLRSHLVNEEALAQRARVLGLGEHLRLGRGEEITGGRQKSSLLAGAYEALVAAVYLEAGYELVRSLVLEHFRDAVEEAVSAQPEADFKSLLQEVSQGKGLGLPGYRVVAEEGPDHEKTFEVEVRVSGGIRGRGKGRTKKEAEQAAARQALEKMGHKPQARDP